MILTRPNSGGEAESFLWWKGINYVALASGSGSMGRKSTPQEAWMHHLIVELAVNFVSGRAG